MTLFNKIKRKLFKRYYRIVDGQKNTFLRLSALEKQNSELNTKLQDAVLKNTQLTNEITVLKNEMQEEKAKNEKLSHEITILNEVKNKDENEIKIVKELISKTEKQLKTTLWENYRRAIYRIHRYMPLTMWQRAVEDESLEHTGYILNLDDPKTLNEKVSWLKLYDQRALLTDVADKYLVRNYVVEKTGNKDLLVGLLGVYDNFDEIDFSSLPEKFVIKTNHGSGYNVIVKSKSDSDLLEIKKTINKYLNEKFGYKNLEPHYLKIKKKIIIEEYLENDNLGLTDYKVFCFNGRPYAILVITGRYTKKQIAFYDLNWNRLPYSIKNTVSMDTDIEKPKRINELLELATKLSEDFTVARVDFYILNSGEIKFSEITLTPAAGHSGLCYEADVDFGKQIKMPIIKPSIYRE